jgi:hypothetical protein
VVVEKMKAGAVVLDGDKVAAEEGRSVWMDNAVEGEVNMLIEVVIYFT